MKANDKKPSAINRGHQTMRFCTLCTAIHASTFRPVTGPLVPYLSSLESRSSVNVRGTRMKVIERPQQNAVRM